MAHSLEIQTPEQTRSTEEIAQAFDYAQMAVGAMQRDPSFHASCVENGVDPQKDRHSIAYWEEFRLYVGERTDKAREEGHDSLQMDAIELLANTPNYLLVQEQLNKHQHRPYDAVHHSKEVASYYNGLIRSFALNYPETSVEDLEVNLLTTVNKNFHSKHLRTVLANDVTPPIRGAQHELAFGQILEHAGLPFRRAELTEDLKGVDYVVGQGIDPLMIDVKASLAEIRDHGSGREFYIHSDGKSILHSQAHDAEFGDRFFIPEQAAEEKAAYLTEQLEAVQQLRHLRHSA
jgi:hypothetical protein